MSKEDSSELSLFEQKMIRRVWHKEEIRNSLYYLMGRNPNPENNRM